MAKKTELLLVKRAMVEAVLEASEGRKAATSGLKPEHSAEGMFEKMKADWENLTTMRVENGVAVIPLRGTISPDDPFAAYFGETSLSSFMQNFNEALASDKVKAIVINAFSPGGFVYGVEGAANAIFAARGQKPILAFTDTLAASAAYWIVSAADKVFLGSETAEVGSIGVYLAHFDYSAMLENMGIKVTEITAGEFKGIGSPYTELTEQDKKLLQADSNYIYTRFVNTVARNRGMEVDAVLKSANGLTFYGSTAVKLGLADAINTFQEVLAMATKDEPVVKTQEQKDTEAAQAAQVTTLQAQVEAQAAQLKAYQDKEAASAKEKLTAECSALVKTAFGREATTEEQEHYCKLDEEGRKMYKATLEETATNRDTLIKSAGLTQEQATEGQDEARSVDKNPLVLAARALGFASPQ